MRRVEYQIARSKRETENEDACSDSAIEDQEFIDYLNDAQVQIQSAIARQHKDVFVEEENYDVVVNQEAYNLPEDTLLDNRISAVFYSDTGQLKDFRRLRSGTLIERVFDRAIDPLMYIRKAGKLLLNPVPDRSVANGLKINYVKRLPALDIRRARVASVTTLNNEITALTLDTTVDFQRDELIQENYFCAVNKDGDQVMRRIPFDNIDAATGIVTISAGFEFEAGETISVGDYITRGKDSTNRSDLADICEPYLVQYMNWKILRRDSSSDSAEQTPELIAMRDEIVEIYKTTDDDIKYPAIEDVQFIDDEDLWNYY
jgi:hypothetical protein